MPRKGDWELVPETAAARHYRETLGAREQLRKLTGLGVEYPYEEIGLAPYAETGLELLGAYGAQPLPAATPLGMAGTEEILAAARGERELFPERAGFARERLRAGIEDVGEYLKAISPTGTEAPFRSATYATRLAEATEPLYRTYAETLLGAREADVARRLGAAGTAYDLARAQYGERLPAIEALTTYGRLPEEVALRERGYRTGLEQVRRGELRTLGGLMAAKPAGLIREARYAPETGPSDLEKGLGFAAPIIGAGLGAAGMAGGFRNLFGIGGARGNPYLMAQRPTIRQ
jgi:hypothetical protein